MAALFSVLLASCTSTTDPTLELGSPGFNAPGTAPAQAAEAATGGSSLQTSSVTTSQQTDAGSPAVTTVMEEGDTALPAEVAYLPAAKPATENPALQSQAAVNAEASTQTAAAATADSAPASAPAESAAQPKAVQASAPTGRNGEGPVAAKPVQVASAATEMNNPVYVTAGEAPQAEQAAPKKKGFLASFFGASSASATSKPVIAQPKPAAPAIKEAAAAAVPAPVAEEKAKPIIQLASADSAAKPLALASLSGGNSASDSGENALPGVRQTALFEIKRKSGLDDDSDVDLHEEDDEPIQVASAAGLARLAPNGLLKQTENVDVACLKPSLVRVLKVVEQHYGKKMIVTSGYRSPSRNRQARGAKNSLHMYCAAADIQIPGVGKWELANYVRSMPGRGGVGTYCHTESVHIDVGPERDWNWRCRRRR
ncbi:MULTISPECIES: YcbK family protein [unclassified Mesorhizobium]|uniref:YcbK family protein n=1 Tax=unclassified Mesorhizobium TaxID=325217 RepID=UPI0030144499